MNIEEVNFSFKKEYIYKSDKDYLLSIYDCIQAICDTKGILSIRIDKYDIPFDFLIKDHIVEKHTLLEIFTNKIITSSSSLVFINQENSEIQIRFQKICL